MRGPARAVWVLLALAGALVAITSAEATPSATKCPIATAGGHHYSVSATKVSCAFADQWVTKLAGRRLAPHAVQFKLSGGPKGFQCVAGTKTAAVAMPEIAGNVQVSGNCAKGLGSFGDSPYFNWVVKRTA